MKFDITLLSPAVQQKIYDDLLHELATNCGNALGTLSEFIFTPIFLLKLTNKSCRVRLEAGMQRLEKRFKEISEDQRIQPPPEIAEPILEEVLKIDDPQLSEMFTELLANASMRSPKRKVHRAFVTTLREMVPDEALILHHVGKHNAIPFIQFMGRKHMPFSAKLTAIDQEIELTAADSLPLYLENLVRLGVLECLEDLIFQNTEATYLELLKRFSPTGVAFGHPYDVQAPFKQRATQTYWKRGFYVYTMYGESFREACCSELRDNHSNVANQVRM